MSNVTEAPFRLSRQQDVVNLLTDLTRRADAGEIVGVLVVYIDSNGIWRHNRNMENSDTPTSIGYLELVKQRFGREYLDGCHDDTPDAG